MTRKDTILIAVVINAGLLSILFTTAMIYDTDSEIVPTELVANNVEKKEINPESASTLVALSTTDEFDHHVLNYYHQSSDQPILSDLGSYSPEPIPVQINAFEEEIIKSPIQPLKDNLVEIRVKKGDALDKIARANGVTTAELKRANSLQGERLSIGQILKIPVKNPVKVNPEPIQSYSEEKFSKESNGATYYVVKSGDNPSKIAKQCQVNVEDILRLNNLDEEKARNMKIGDKIRVK